MASSERHSNLRKNNTRLPVRMLGRERVKFLFVDDEQGRPAAERRRHERVMARVIDLLGLTRCPNRIYTARRYMRMQKRLPAWAGECDLQDSAVLSALDLPADMRLTRSEMTSHLCEWTTYNRVLTYLWIDSAWPQEGGCSTA